MKHLGAAVLAIGLASPVSAQDWGDLDALLAGSLTETGQLAASFWLPNAADPNSATLAIGVAHEPIGGAAGNSGIAVGVFVRQQNRWVLAGQVENLYGQKARDAAFYPEHVDLTTTMPGPDDPRCCPTQSARWRIDLATLQVRRLQ